MGTLILGKVNSVHKTLFPTVLRSLLKIQRRFTLENRIHSIAFASDLRASDLRKDCIINLRVALSPRS